MTGHPVAAPSGMISRIGLVLHPYRPLADAIAVIAAWAHTHGIELVATADHARRAGTDRVRAVPPEQLADGCDRLIALGGDGTILGALRLVAGRPAPVLGVNLGRLGLLAEVEARELEAALTALAEGRGTVEPRSCLIVEHHSHDYDTHKDDERKDQQWLAFNDLVLARVPGAGLVEATLSVAGQRYGHYRCDALIAATPMGSTAYNYAAGGPVVSPAADAVLLTPSAPMSGIGHPLVLGPQEPLTVEVTAGAPAVELDGLVQGHLSPPATLRISLRPGAAQLVRLPGSRAADRSRIKLSLLDLPCLPHELAELLPEHLHPPMSDAAMASGGNLIRSVRP